MLNETGVLESTPPAPDEARNTGTKAGRALWPLVGGARLPWLRVCAAVAEGAHVVDNGAVAAVLRDAARRLCVLGGRDGQPRSLGSVYACFVTLFLGTFRGWRVHRAELAEDPDDWVGDPKRWVDAVDFAVSRDGTALVACLNWPEALAQYRLADGVLLRQVRSAVEGPLTFSGFNMRVHIPPDDAVLVLDSRLGVVYVLTPQLGFVSSIHVGRQETSYSAACFWADAAVVAVTHTDAMRVRVFSRADGSLLRRVELSCYGSAQQRHIDGLCFMPRRRHWALVEREPSGTVWTVSVCAESGGFLRRVTHRDLRGWTSTISCTEFDELIVESAGAVVVFGADDAPAVTCFDRYTGYVIGIVAQNGCLFVLDTHPEEENLTCTVFS